MRIATRPNCNTAYTHHHVHPIRIPESFLSSDCLVIAIMEAEENVRREEEGNES
jgi:hypothetical protein